MSKAGYSEPQFPLRVIFEDGAVETIETPEALLDKLESIDTVAERDHVWVRDALDRTVRLRMVGGEVEAIEVESQDVGRRT